MFVGADEATGSGTWTLGLGAASCPTLAILAVITLLAGGAAVIVFPPDATGAAAAGAPVPALLDGLSVAEG